MTALLMPNWLAKEISLLSAVKVLALVFWDSRDVILIDYLDKGKTVTRVLFNIIKQSA